MKSKNDLLKSKLTRRTFLQGMAAVGSTVAVAGCSSDDEPLSFGNTSTGGFTVLPGAVLPEDLSEAKIYHAGCTHNCGTGVRCVSRLHVINGVVKRVTTDEGDFAWDGTFRDKEQYNDARSLTCPKGRAFKFRSHHPGRLRYALKQTKQRGDMSGFVSIPVQQALSEIATKYRAIHGKYGAGAIHDIYATSGGYDGVGGYANYASVIAALTSPAGRRPYYADYSYHQYHYGYLLTGHPSIGNAYNKQCNVAWQYPAISGAVKNVVSWGSNILSTNNASAWGYIKSFENLRKNGGRAWFIGPELSDTGVTCHTDWVQLRNYTDVALIMGMMYHMLVNTFNADGSLMANPMLDVDYLDTMVYGFFDSPEYWLHNTNGTIVTTEPAASDLADYTYVEEVPAGKSLSAYVMGSDTRLTLANYNDTDVANYTATQFGNRPRNGAVCSYTATEGENTKYLYKQAFQAPKTPTWASAITGTPEAQIIELAEMYCDEAQHPIFNEWCGGLQKQGNGVINIWAVSALMAVTKTFGLTGETFSGAWASTLSAGPKGNDNNLLEGIDLSAITGVPSITSVADTRSVTLSAKEWFNGIKLAFHDKLVASPEYDGSQIPDWDFANNRYYFNDGGVKTGVVYKRNADGSLATRTVQDAQGNDVTVYDWVEENGSPVYAGTRMVLNFGGGIMVNQHMNTNDSAATYKALPLSGEPTDPDTPCFVTMDVFMSPTARYMDYVLPCAVNLETVDFGVLGGPTWLGVPILGSQGVSGAFRPPVVPIVGDVMDSYEMTYNAYKAQSLLGEYTDPSDTLTNATTSGIENSHLAYANIANEGEYRSAADRFDDRVDEAINNVNSRFYGKTKDEVYATTFTPFANQDEYIATSHYETKGTSPVVGDATTHFVVSERDDISPTGQIRKNLDEYLDLPAATRRTKPFINLIENGVKNACVASTYFHEGSFGTPTGGNSQIIDEYLANRPNPAGRMQVYSGMLVFDYENSFSKYHGWLPVANRGQENVDAEGDPLVYPIPMYFNFEDFFNEAFGAFNATPKNADFVDGTGLTLGTTHNRYRVHSTHNENPFLRELNHRVKGGGPANDWKEYAVIPEGAATTQGMISNAVEKEMDGIASWHEIWINTQDAADNGVKHGDLIEVYNPIGAVRVIAKVTDRCVRGHINLHQGGWYDPNEDGVDDGGCANTLIASRPSRIDHGNAQQMCYVKIRKV